MLKAEPAAKAVPTAAPGADGKSGNVPVKSAAKPKMPKPLAVKAKAPDAVDQSTNAYPKPPAQAKTANAVGSPPPKENQPMPKSIQQPPAKTPAISGNVVPKQAKQPENQQVAKAAKALPTQPKAPAKSEVLQPPKKQPPVKAPATEPPKAVAGVQPKDPKALAKPKANPTDPQVAQVAQAQGNPKVPPKKAPGETPMNPPKAAKAEGLPSDATVPKAKPSDLMPPKAKPGKAPAKAAKVKAEPPKAQEAPLPFEGAAPESLLVAVDEASSHEKQVVEQIDLDLPRTFPKTPEVESQKISIRNVLLTYSRSNPHIGYCQGMSFPAAVLCANLSESAANARFQSCLQKVRELWLPGFHIFETVKQAFDVLLAHQSESLAQAFQAQDVILDVFLLDAWLTMFARWLPFKMLFRVLEFVELQGFSGVLSLTVALVSSHGPSIIGVDKADALLNLWKCLQWDVSPPPLEELLEVAKGGGSWSWYELMMFPALLQF